MATDWSNAPKDPEEIRDYAIDWTADIGALTISSKTWSVVSQADAAGNSTVITLVVSAGTIVGKTTVTRISAGTLGHSNLVKCHIILSDGEETEKTLKLKIKAK